MSVPLPQYGNYGGNGNNDAWEQADRYYTYLYNNIDPATKIVTQSHAQSYIMPPVTMQRYSVPRTSTGAAITRDIVLNKLGRKPKDDQDAGYMNHDLGSISQSLMDDIQNHLNMGDNVYEAIKHSNGNMDFDAYVYGFTSIPLMGYAGSGYSIMMNIGNSIRNSYGDTSDLVVDEIVVTPAGVQGDYQNLVAYTTTNQGPITTTFTVFKDSWDSFASAIKIGLVGGLVEGFSGMWNWLKEVAFNSGGSRPAPEPDPLEIDLDDYVVTPFARGDQIGANDLALLDDDKDGFLTEQDRNFDRFGLWIDENSDGVVDDQELHTFEELDIDQFEIGTPGVTVYTIYGTSIVQHRDDVEEELVGLTGQGAPTQELIAA